jgi:hypothetical protein
LDSCINISLRDIVMNFAHPDDAPATASVDFPHKLNLLRFLLRILLINAHLIDPERPLAIR